MASTRRLAAILAADVAGYSRLIGADEGDTLQALKAIRAELIDPTIAAHNGRLVKTTGDGLLVEFSSVVNALRCATEVQAGMAERCTDAPHDKRIQFRIGINVGDIVVEDGDIFGDGVNVAARLEALAEPGGICVSARVQEDAAGKLDLAFEDIAHAELAPDLLHLDRLAFIGEGRIASDHKQPADTRECGDDLLDHAVAKYSCSGSPLKLAKGSTAIDGLSGRGRSGATAAVEDTAPVAIL